MASPLKAKIRNFLFPRVGNLNQYSPRKLETRFAVNCPQSVGFDINRVWPKITIVVPSFNQGSFIGATLESIVSQCYPNLELIVIDGGSTDSTIDIILKYQAHINWWVSESDSGQSAAINKGFKRSTGDILAWINSDDLVVPGAFYAVANHFVNNGSDRVIYGDRILIDQNGLEVGSWILPKHSSSTLKWVDFVPQETLYWTRVAWERVGSALDESLQFAMDWDLLLRFMGCGLKMQHLPVFLGMFRIHHNQKTSRQILSFGLQEMQLLRQRELGYKPSNLQIGVHVLPYFLRARLLEIATNWHLRATAAPKNSGSLGCIG